MCPVLAVTASSAHSQIDGENQFAHEVNKLATVRNHQWAEQVAHRHSEFECELVDEANLLCSKRRTLQEVRLISHQISSQCAQVHLSG